ncbi:glycosyltransferase [Bradyrhizobium sp. 141]|uniref:glycosyltransferase n=1 Tax=Bradyrhizobium sp. 141 TaxID=2782617 RepID=UPI001FF95AAA|nr:glycosyltransferase [Bradyrhizobium sp. 141]MCK1722063.1 glycosyltransferase [Bradyrhizobium sp. 141]
MIIVHVLTRFLRGGSEENTLTTCRAQAAAGHDVVVVHGRDFDPALQAEAAETVRVIEISSMVHPISPANDIAAVITMSALFRKLGAHVVHTHQSKAGILGRSAAALAKTPTVIHGVHILPFVNVGKAQELIYVAAERFCSTFTDGFINVSPSVRDICLQYKIGKPSKHFVAFSAMNVDRFKSPAPPADWRELLNVMGAQKRPPTAIMLASFEPRKRQLELIQAIPEAFAGLPDWRLVFAGVGETEDEAKALVKRLGLEDKIRFAGFRKDPEAIIALADVCLLTSMREGLPRVLVQYAAAGKPSVVSRLPGVEDVVRDGVSAVLTPADDVAAAAKAAGALLADKALLEQLSKGALAIDVDAWSPRSMNAAIDNAYSDIMK